MLLSQSSVKASSYVLLVSSRTGDEKLITVPVAIEDFQGILKAVSKYRRENRCFHYDIKEIFQAD